MTERTLDLPEDDGAVVRWKNKAHIRCHAILDFALGDDERTWIVPHHGRCTDATLQQMLSWGTDVEVWP